MLSFNSCKKEEKKSNVAIQEESATKVKPNVILCGDGYHWDYTLHECVPNCPSGYIYCPEIGDCVPSNPGCGGGGTLSDVSKFENSSDFQSFSNSNPTIMSKIGDNTQVITEYNQLLGDSIKSIHLPVYESNGSMSGVVIGVPVTVDSVTSYLIFYQNNESLFTNSSGYIYGTVGIDLYNSTVSYTVQSDSTCEIVSDTLVSGPQWINNYSCQGCRTVWPTGTCIDNVMDEFWNRCHGFCRFWCRLNDALILGACTGGQYIGAAVWCALHNNNYAAY